MAVNPYAMPSMSQPYHPQASQVPPWAAMPSMSQPFQPQASPHTPPYGAMPQPGRPPGPPGQAKKNTHLEQIRNMILQKMLARMIGGQMPMNGRSFIDYRQPQLQPHQGYDLPPQAFHPIGPPPGPLSAAQIRQLTTALAQGQGTPYDGQQFGAQIS